ncbi:MAG: prepilin peptidase [Nitrospinales bacterium]
MGFLEIAPPWLLTGFIFFIGLAVGSFLNVCIYRMPIAQSVVSPRSHCPSCKSLIRVQDNVPVISYILLRGKCRQCGASISPVYPLVELGAGVLFAAVFIKFGIAWQTPIFWVVAAALVAVAAIDLKHKIIPDRITLPGIVFGLAAGTYLIGFRESLTGFFVGGGLFYAIAVLSKGGMGGGDIKLIAAAGALLGWQKTLLVIFLASFLGSCVGIPLILAGRKHGKSQIPFGPFLAAGIIAAIFSGDSLIQLYLRIMTGNI